MNKFNSLAWGKMKKLFLFAMSVFDLKAGSFSSG